VGPERLAGPREPAAAEPFTPGRFIRPRVMLKPSSVGEWTCGRGSGRLYEQPVDLPSIVATVRYAAPLRQLGGAPAAVTTVHLNDPELVDDLMELLRGSDCIVDRLGPRSVAIRSGWPVRDDAAQYELDGYLRVFEAMHPGARAMRDCR
jgi:hypothetical protein